MRRTDQQQWLSMLGSVDAASHIPLFGFHAVERGWSINLPSGLPEHLIYLVAAGRCEGAADRRRVRLGPGSLMWLGPGVPLSLRLSDPRRPITLYRFRLLAPGSAGRTDRVVLVDDAWELRPVFDALVSELAGAMPFREPRLRALLLLLFTGVFRLAQRQGAGRTLSGEQRRRLEAYADAHLHDRLTPDDLAAVVGLSPDYFARRFRQTYGVAPKTWLVRRRIHHAALRLDESDDPVSVVASDLGYPDLFLFSRQFKMVMGRSPRHYRARSQ